MLFVTVSEEEAEEKGWRRESVQDIMSGWDFEGRPQASRARGREALRFETVMVECGSGVFWCRAWGARRGGIFVTRIGMLN